MKDVLFRVLADHSPRPILITNDAPEIVYVNKAWQKQFGYSFAEMYGKNPRVLQSGKTPRKIYKSMWSALKAGKAFQTDKIQDRRKNGRLFNMFSTVFPVVVHKRTFYIQILDDITKRKKLQEYQSAFIKIAAHDIRSPLAGIQLMGELLALKANEPTPGDMTEDIQSLQDEIVKANKLTASLLDISLFESGKVRLHRGRVRLGPLVDEVIAHARRIAPSQKFVVEHISDTAVRADRERIRQVLINLVENAIKYAPGPEPITISVVQKKKSMYVFVRDRGPGITKKAAVHIFRLFYRTDSAKKAKIAGHGLGLHIAHKIIQAHHGRISVTPRKGGGSVFFFTLPLAAAS